MLIFTPFTSLNKKGGLSRRIRSLDSSRSDNGPGFFLEWIRHDNPRLQVHRCQFFRLPLPPHRAARQPANFRSPNPRFRLALPCFTTLNTVRCTRNPCPAESGIPSSCAQPRSLNLNPIENCDDDRSLQCRIGEVYGSVSGATCVVHFFLTRSRGEDLSCGFLIVDRSSAITCEGLDLVERERLGLADWQIGRLRQHDAATTITTTTSTLCLELDEEKKDCIRAEVRSSRLKQGRNSHNSIINNVPLRQSSRMGRRRNLRQSPSRP